MWVFLIIIIVIAIVLIFVISTKISSAKDYFDELVLINQTMQEVTKEECELKMSSLQTSKITFSTWLLLLLLFWAFFRFGIGFIICIVLGFSNKSTRMTYKNQELTRLQMKINNFVLQEIFQKKFNF